MIEHVAFFGDGEKVFKLTPALIVELERKCSCGIGGLAKRLLAGEYRHSEVIEIIILSLIGGGTDHEEAHTLSQAYCLPVLPAYGIAVSVLEATLFGEKTNEG